MGIFFNKNNISKKTIKTIKQFKNSVKSSSRGNYRDSLVTSKKSSIKPIKKKNVVKKAKKIVSAIKKHVG